jgi:hypothetical protein
MSMNPAKLNPPRTPSAATATCVSST